MESILDLIVEIIINPFVFYIIGLILIVTGIILAANQSGFIFLLSSAGIIILGLGVIFFKIRKDISEFKKTAKK